MVTMQSAWSASEIGLLAAPYPKSTHNSTRGNESPERFGDRIDNPNATYGRISACNSGAVSDLFGRVDARERWIIKYAVHRRRSMFRSFVADAADGAARSSRLAVGAMAAFAVTVDF